MPQIFDAFGTPLEYRACTLEDIDKHFRYVRRIVNPEDRVVYKERMKQAVEGSTAFCIAGSNIFLYYIKTDDYISEGVSLSSKGKPLEWLALLTAMAFLEDTVTTFIRFHLHDKNRIQDFLSLVEVSSIKGQLSNPKQVTIRVDKLRNRIKKLGVL